MNDVETCGWCGTPLDADPWCDHCLEERNLAEVDKARKVLQLHRLVGPQRRRVSDDE